MREHNIRIIGFPRDVKKLQVEQRFFLFVFDESERFLRSSLKRQFVVSHDALSHAISTDEKQSKKKFITKH
jgi:hypothetical protein